MVRKLPFAIVFMGKGGTVYDRVGNTNTLVELPVASS